MSVIAATIQDVNLVSAPANIGARYAYQVNIKTGTMTAGDTAAITGANTLIAAFQKHGKTVTLRQCAGGVAGITPGGTAAYALAATVNTASLEFSVGGTTAAAAVAAGTVVPLFVTVDLS